MQAREGKYIKTDKVKTNNSDDGATSILRKKTMKDYGSTYIAIRRQVKKLRAQP